MKNLKYWEMILETEISQIEPPEQSYQVVYWNRTWVGARANSESKDPGLVPNNTIKSHKIKTIIGKNRKDMIKKLGYVWIRIVRSGCYH